MCNTKLPLSGKVVLALVILLLGAGPALAYIGPGAGLKLVPKTQFLLLLALFAVCAVLLWPVYALLRFLRGKKRQPTDAQREESGQEDPVIR